MTVYPDLSFKDYRALEAHNWSSISKLEEHSPAQFRWVLDNPDDEEHRYFVIGRAVHTAVLEPHLFEKEFFTEPHWDGGFTKDGRPTKSRKSHAYADFRRKWQSQVGGREVLSHDESAQVKAIAAAVSRHPVAGHLLSGAAVEQSITWADPVTSLRCKGRIDAVTPAGRLVDLKTTSGISPRSFNSSVWSYGYVGQLAYYLDGASDGAAVACGLRRGPRVAAVFKIGPEALAVGRRMYRGYLNTIKFCEELGAWPGYAEDHEVEVKVPARYLAMFDEPDTGEAA